MTVALSPVLPADTIQNLIVADIAPSNASQVSPEFQRYIEAMNKIEQSRVSSRREAQDILAPYEPVGSLSALRMRVLSHGSSRTRRRVRSS